MVDTAKEPQPLVSNQKIVNPDGTPTDYFIRWAQERQIAIQEGITMAELEEFFAEHPLQEGTGISILPDGSIAHSPTIALDAGLGDLNDVDFSTPPVDGDTIIYDLGSGKFKPGAGGGGGGGAYHPPVIRNSDAFFFNANFIDVLFPAGSAVGDYAVIGTNHAWDFALPAGWTLVSHLSGTNITGGVIYKVLDLADIAAGKVTINYTNINQGCAIICVYIGASVLSVVLGSEERTAGPHVGNWTTTAAINPAATLFLYGGIGDYAATVFSVGTPIASALGPVGSVSSADLYGYTPPGVGIVSGTANHTSSINGTYTACVIIRGVSFVEEAPADGQLYARQNDAWTAFTPGGGGGGGGGAPATARHWRLRAVEPADGHGGDGFGLVNLQWLDKSGTNLVGSGTPSASRTDGSWNLAQGFQPNMSAGHGWYSGNGDGAFNSSPWIAYDFGAEVTPVKFLFAPLNGFTWTIGQILAVESSHDGEIWYLNEMINVRPGTSGATETYNIVSGSSGGDTVDFGIPLNTVSASGSAQSAKGSTFTAIDDFVLLGAAPSIDLVAGATYEAYAVTLTGGNTVNTVLATTAAPFVAPANNRQPLVMEFANSASINAGDKFAIIIARTDAIGAYSLPLLNPSLLWLPTSFPAYNDGFASFNVAIAPGAVAASTGTGYGQGYYIGGMFSRS